MRPVCSYTDFFVICTGQNPRQTTAIYDAVHEQMKHAEARLLPQSVDGQREASWIVAGVLPARGSVGRRTVGRARGRDGLTAAERLTRRATELEEERARAWVPREDRPTAAERVCG
jgi:hypothetical protein